MHSRSPAVRHSADVEDEETARWHPLSTREHIHIVKLSSEILEGSAPQAAARRWPGAL